MGWQHVYPINDLIEHDIRISDSNECACNPKIDVENMLVIHNAMDRRECFGKDLINIKVPCIKCGDYMVTATDTPIEKWICAKCQ